jgi:competence protein ComEC
VNLIILVFVAASVLVTWLPRLPEPGLLIVMLVIAVCTAACPRTRIIAGFLSGIVYCSMAAHERLTNWLPSDFEGVDLKVTGMVASLPEDRDGIRRFRFRCEDCWSPATIVLSAYDRDLALIPGERWQFMVRLRRPRGLVNPGLFDYQGWLLAQDIVATGYVLPSADAVRLEVAGLRQLPNRFRATIRAAIRAASTGPGLSGLVTALTIGENAGISPRDWETLSKTGTNHLLIISGLHVGLVAAGTLLFANILIRLCGFNLPRLSFAFSFVCACGYGALAGLGLPVQRALIMTGIALWSVVSVRRPGLFKIYCLALLGVTLLDPFAPLGAGFWLSFGAVGLLLFGFGGRVAGDSSPGLLKWSERALKSQWLVYVGMSPILLAVVDQVSVVAFAANLIAIPWVSLLVVPVLLVASVMVVAAIPGSESMIQLGEFLLYAIWRVLERLADLDMILTSGGAGLLSQLVAILGAIILLVPRGLVPRWIGVVLLLPVFLPLHDDLTRGSFELSVLDVGQGLAIAVRTSEHTLLYDAGPRYGERFDTGREIVVPFLRSKGIHVIDDLVLSHGDIDHAGGVAAVMDAFTVARTRGLTVDSCRAAEVILEGAVSMVLLGQPPGSSSNDRSCILLIEAAGFAVLLPGDIEEVGESYVMNLDVEADLVVAPHHGSASSSGPGFLNQLKPKFAVFSTGYGNRFGHPDASVMRRYHLRGVRLYNTADDGAVTLTYHPGELPEINRARFLRRRFWYD